MKVSNPGWIKAAIMLGVPGFFFIGVFVISHSLTSTKLLSVGNLIALMSGLFVLVVAVPQGLVLLRFVNHELHIDDIGIEIRKGNVGKYLPWGHVGRIKVHDVSQVLKLYDKTGRLVYAVDFYATNFYPFYALLQRQMRSSDNVPRYQ